MDEVHLTRLLYGSREVALEAGLLLLAESHAKRWMVDGGKSR
jgi:hypothetical protein